MKKLFTLFSLFALISPKVAMAGDDKVLNPDQWSRVKKALQELDEIKKSPAILTIQDTIEIIHDWEGRVYTNGGDKKPLKVKLTIGNIIDRDLSVEMKTKVWYREKPMDPIFRIRIRAQVGVLVPDLITKIKGNGGWPIDAGLGLDFMHFGPLNLAAYAGVFSFGAQIGFDLTKNFGTFVGYSMVYDGWRSNLLIGTFFSFN